MIIGSTAIKHYFSDFNREPKDIDIVIHAGIKERVKLINDKRVEYLENPVLISYVYNTWCVLPNNNCYENLDIPKYCPIDYLYTLKISHSFWDLENGSWEKHMWDIQFLKEKGCKFVEDLFYELYEYWTKIHGKRKTSDLSMNAEDFFNNAIKYPIPHDDCHKLLIEHPYFEGQLEPTYTKVLKDGCEVDVDENKFNKLTEKEKFNLAFEEVAVMATERFDTYYKSMYSKMLKKFILNHCPIWEGIWIIQNHKELMKIPFDFKKFLNNKIK